MAKIEQGTLIRLLGCAVLGVTVVGLFIFNRMGEINSPQEPDQDFAFSVQAIDKEVDVVLGHFGIEKSWVRRKEIKDSSRHFIRVERRVAIPPHVVPAMMNRELNSLAHRFHGRAVATENLRDNSVTIHIILQQTVIQTVILKINPEIEKKEPGAQLKKV